jgi:hypothetical protein
MHEAGCRALWLGVEDMTATLVNKGQSVDKTIRGVRPPARRRHLPDADDDAPRPSRSIRNGTNYGLLNQIKVLRKAGAVSLQVLMMTPSAGTKLYEATFTERPGAEASAGGRRVEPYMYDGNYVIASSTAAPGKSSSTCSPAISRFTTRLLMALSRRFSTAKPKVSLKPAGMQLIGMIGLIQTIRRTSGWAVRG